MTDLQQLVSTAMLASGRVTGLLMFAPVLGNTAIPARAKAGLAIVLSALMYPAYHAQVQELSAANWIAVFASELCIGAVLGVCAQFVFDGVALAGQAMGMQLGFSLASVFDPQSQADSSVLSSFYQTIALLLFLALGVHHSLLRALARSFEYCPAGTALSAVAGLGLVRASGAVWLIGVQIAGPALLATMLTDVVLGLIGKASPQLPVLLVGISVKSVVGLLVISVSLCYWPALLDGFFSQAIATGEQLLGLVVR